MRNMYSAPRGRSAQAGLPILWFGLTVLCFAFPVAAQQDRNAQQAAAAMKSAAGFYYGKLNVHGGYVYHYTLDLSQRWGEGLAGPTQIWVQPPGTPTVGMAFLRAYEATGDQAYLGAATKAAEAIAYGQLESGGWTNSIEFNPRSDQTAQYRNGKGRGKDNSSLDDGQTQSALQFLIQCDRALDFKNATIHDSAAVGLQALRAAQFPNGAFPQVWTGPVSEQPVLPASYPDYDWRTEGRIKEYWTMYTLNDDVAGYVTDLLIDANSIYDEPIYLEMLRKLGDFLILAQMPEPQPGWAQQYNYEMKPIWARKFEPPAVSGDETQEAIKTLMKIAVATGDKKYLQPIDKALRWLQQSRLPDGRIARYYELKTNRPLYMQRDGKKYELTYSDARLPDHYGWKTESEIETLRNDFGRLSSNLNAKTSWQPDPPSWNEVQAMIKQLDEQGRWISVYRGERLVGQPKMPMNGPYLSSETFSNNISAISRYLISLKSSRTP
ncbi:MAG: pectate lyase [Pirellulaceae bacterium]